MALDRCKNRCPLGAGASFFGHHRWSDVTLTRSGLRLPNLQGGRLTTILRVALSGAARSHLRCRGGIDTSSAGRAKGEGGLEMEFHGLLPTAKREIDDPRRGPEGKTAVASPDPYRVTRHHMAGQPTRRTLALCPTSDWIGARRPPELPPRRDG